MYIDSNTIGAFYPHGNLELRFSVADGTTFIQDPHTGNYQTPTTTLDYLVAAQLTQPSSQDTEPGPTRSSYQVTGRLLSPMRLDPRIVNESEAIAYYKQQVHGRFTVRLNLEDYHNEEVLNTIRGSISGVLTLDGGIGT